MTKKGTRLALPTDLYDFGADVTTQIATPGNDQFGGADISIVSDAKDTLFAGFTARELATREFGFVIWNLTKNVKVPYAPFCNARGELNDQGRWAAWNSNEFFFGPIPGFVLHPTTLALEKKIAALQATVLAFDAELTALAHLLDGSPPTITGGTLTIPAQGPPLEGGEIRLADGAGGWITIDGRAGNLRVSKGGVVLERWPKG